METKIFTIDELDKAGGIIRNGGLVAFPTETVYGLGRRHGMKTRRKKYTQQRADRPTIRL